MYIKGAKPFDVAIKTLRGKHHCNYYAQCIIFNYIAVENCKTEQFIKECIMAKQFSHPNVLSLIGVSYLEDEALPLMILPFMHNGDVKSFVKCKRKTILQVTKYPKVKLRVYI